MRIQGLFQIEKWDFNSKSILADLPGEDLEILYSHKTRHRFSKGEIIFREGSLPSGIFSIVRGKVKMFKVDKEGREHIIYIANTGELLGYHAILAEGRYPDSAAALEESTIAFIPKEDFLDTLKQSALLNSRLLKTLGHEFAVLANGLTLYAQKPVRERLALHLILLREKFKTDFHSGEIVEISISRDDLASLVGTARENVVRILTEFKEAGILATHGRKILIQDVSRLIHIADY